MEGTKRYLDLGLLLSALTTSLLFITPNALYLIIFYSLTGATMGMYPAALVAYVARAGSKTIYVLIFSELMLKEPVINNV